MQNLIDGRAISGQIHAETTQRVAALRQRGVEPGLVFVRVGEDPASQVYVGMKERKSRELGIRSETIVLPTATSQADLLALIHQLNQNPACINAQGSARLTAAAAHSQTRGHGQCLRPLRQAMTTASMSTVRCAGTPQPLKTA